MTATGHEHLGDGSDRPGTATSRISIPWVIFAALLCGIGLFLLSYWLTYFYWPAFSGAAFVIIGGVLLFNRRTGIDRA
ncbi:MAG: hypothetical protein ABSA15_06870 [Thermoplasmata archaeon]|jgi:hypothetical protein